jgi:hypothetical protein
VCCFHTAGASKFAVGQRVAIAGFPVETGNGSWQEYAAYPEADLAAVPDSVSDEEAAQFWVSSCNVSSVTSIIQPLSKASRIDQNAQEIREVQSHYDTTIQYIALPLFWGSSSSTLQQNTA